MVMLIIASSSCLAQESLVRNMRINDDYFEAGDYIDIDTLISNKGLDISSLVVHETIVFPSNYPPVVHIRSLDLSRDDSMHIRYSFDVYDTMPNGEYAYMLNLYSGDELLESHDLWFFVNKTLNTFKDPYLLSCSDLECRMRKTVFSVDEDYAFVKAFDIEDALIGARIMLPDNTEDALKFNEYVAKIPLSKRGDYEVMAELTKPGYKPMVIRWVFYVFKEPTVGLSLMAKLTVVLVFIIVAAIAALGSKRYKQWKSVEERWADPNLRMKRRQRKY